jgi:hypothetical protein
VVFGAGLTMLVAPLTATVLDSADDRFAGVASGVNNAVARAAGLLSVAVVPVAAGIGGDDYTDPDAFGEGFRMAMLICAGLLVVGALVAAAAIRRPPPRTGRDDGTGRLAVEECLHCDVDGPRLHPRQRAAAPSAVSGGRRRVSAGSVPDVRPPAPGPEADGQSSAGGRGLLARVAPLRRSLRTEAGSAGLLLAATVVALLWANSPWATATTTFWHTEFAVRMGGAELALDLQHWVNDGLMVFFFFVVGLEIKRELVIGELTDRAGPRCRRWPPSPGWPCRRWSTSPSTSATRPPRRGGWSSPPTPRSCSACSRWSARPARRSCGCSCSPSPSPTTSGRSPSSRSSTPRTCGWRRWAWPCSDWR